MARKKVIEIVLDTETTGLDYTREKMVEFAAVRLENGKIKDEFQTLINPEQHIRKSSIAIHGITEDMVADAPTEKEPLIISAVTLLFLFWKLLLVVFRISCSNA